MDALIIALSAAMFFQVWRLHDFYRIFGALHPGFLMPPLLIGLFAMDRDPRRSLKPLSGTLFKLALVLLALMCLSVPFALYPGMSFGFVTKDYIPNVVVMVMIAASVRNVVDVERMALAQVIGGAFFCYTVITRFHVDSNGRLGNLAAYDANDFAMLIVCTLPLAVYFVRRPGKLIWKCLAMASIGLFMIGIVRSGSRGGFLGLVAVSITLLVSFRAVPARVRIGVVVALFGILVVFASDQYWGFITTLMHPTTDYNWAGNSGGGRMEIWKRGIGYMATHPLVGVGPQNFPIAEGRLSPRALEAMRNGRAGVAWMAAHNSYVQIGAELGVFGVTAFIALLFTALKKLRPISRLKPEQEKTPVPRAALAQVLTASIIGFVVTAFFLSQAYAAYLYINLGIIMGLAKLSRAPSQEPVGTAPRRGRRPALQVRLAQPNQRTGPGGPV